MRCRRDAPLGARSVEQMLSPDEILRITHHRPWKLPRGPWVMTQGWHDLLFAHWPLPAERLRPLVPELLKLDTCDGSAWLSLTPFCLSVKPRALPMQLRCPELNCRTYVEYGGKPGIYFFSLDAASRIAVEAARLLYLLPYFHAKASIRKEGSHIHYSLQREGTGAEFAARYAGVQGESRAATRGSLEHWLTERYCLYTCFQNRLYRGEIHHGPWPLQDATGEIRSNSIAAASGIRLPEQAPLLHYSRGVDVLVWPLIAAI
jgi:uncharacterized protein